MNKETKQILLFGGVAVAALLMVKVILSKRQ